MVQELVAAREADPVEVLDEAEWLLYVARVVDGIADRLLTVVSAPGGTPPDHAHGTNRDLPVARAVVGKPACRLPRSPPR